MKKLDESEIEAKLSQIPGWDYENDAIHTSFEFEDFKDAFAAMTRIAFEAEAKKHHPDWTNVYNELHITLTTHSAEGVTLKDFEMAILIDEIIANDES